MAANLAYVESDAFKINHDQWPQYHAYKPLDPLRKEIRLLRMFKERSDDLLKFELRHHSLNDNPQYDALSYYWGIPTSHKTIVMNDTAVQIRETLYQFLSCLWLRFGSIVIWLDVLSINQRDLKERNMQVNIMASIFQSAQNVFAWLGYGDPDCEYSMTEIVKPRSATADLSVQQALSLRQCAEQLLMRPYWTRVWVVQEVILARNLSIFYGSQIATWHDLKSCIEFVDGFRESTLIPRLFIDSTDAYDRYRRLQRGKLLRLKGQNDVCKLAELFNYARCTDPRDKLYGIRGIANNGELIDVDYAKSPTQIFFDYLSCSPRDISNIKSSHIPPILNRATQLSHGVPLFHADIEETLRKKNNYHLVDWLSWLYTLPSNKTLITEGGSDGFSSFTDSTTSMHHVFELRTRSSRRIRLAFGSLNGHSRAIQVPISRYQEEHSTDEGKLCVGNVEICRMNKLRFSSEGQAPKVLLVHISPAAILALLAVSFQSRMPSFLERFLEQQASVDSDCLCHC